MLLESSLLMFMILSVELESIGLEPVLLCTGASEEVPPPLNLDFYIDEAFSESSPPWFSTWISFALP